MKLWQTLYAFIWLTVLQFMLVFLPFMIPFRVEAHATVGLIVLAVAHYNRARVKKTDALGRTKRTMNVTAGLATFQVVLGVPLVAIRFYPALAFLEPAFRLLHLLVALAIVTQAASVATGYDIWESKESTA